MQAHQLGEALHSPPSRSLAAKRTSRSFSFLSTTLLLFLTFSGSLNLSAWHGIGVQAAPAMAEPAGNQVYFGAWIDTSAQFGDSATAFNKRLGLNVPIFQISQQIPLPPFDYVTGAGGEAPEATVEQSGTDAAVFLTVYPQQGLDQVQQRDLDELAEQIARYQAKNRTVFLRYGPEMQGNWNVYGLQPTAFVAQWKTMYTTMKEKAPGTIVVWAPNTGAGYPYGQDLPPDAADSQALDTNQDGQLSNDDDPYQPFFPGPEFVDWIGMSIYFKGLSGGQGAENDGVQATGFCSSEFTTVLPDLPGLANTFYERYCRLDGKACMMAESGAAFHVDHATGPVTELQIKQAWIEDCISNATMYQTFDRLKLVMQFEHQKNESVDNGAEDDRDYRLTNNTQVLSALQSAFQANSAQFTWANPRAIPTSLPPGDGGSGGPTTDALGNTISPVPDVISATIRARPSGPPTLFGNKHVASALVREAVELGVLVGCVGVGMGVVMKWL